MATNEILMEYAIEIHISDKVEELKKELEKQLPASLHFNSYERLESLIVFCTNAAEYYELSDKTFYLMQAAIISLFYGLKNDYLNFRARAKQQVTKLFVGLDPDEIQEIESMIKATRAGGKTLPQNIVHDAWWSYMGQKKFKKKMALLKIEKEQQEKKEIPQDSWDKECLATLSSVQFLTDYARKELGSRKDKNLIKTSKDKENGKSNKPKKRGRGIETMYRAVYRNHINLSSIADAKANMMISINTIIMSVIITGITGFSFSSSVFFDRLQYVVPVFVLLFASLISVVFAIMSARPEVTSKQLKLEKFQRKQSSYLFFGNFVNMELAKFIKRLTYYRSNQPELYDDMSIDIYHLGKVLDKKYKLLRISYNIFMAGLILSVLTFIFVMLYVKLLAT